MATILQLGLLEGIWRANVHRSVTATILSGSPSITALLARVAAFADEPDGNFGLVRLKPDVHNVQLSNADEIQCDVLALLPALVNSARESGGYLRVEKTVQRQCISFCIGLHDQFVCP